MLLGNPNRKIKFYPGSKRVLIIYRYINLNISSKELFGVKMDIATSLQNEK